MTLTEKRYSMKFITRRTVIAIVSVAAIGGALTACTNSATYSDSKSTNVQLEQYQRVQPIPFHEWSQYRQTLISVDDAQARGTATTSFFFNAGVANPVKVCPSIGYAVPSTAQLTNPWQSNGNGVGIGMMEPTGVYTGESSGTYVVCVVNGKAVPTYWEGNVETEGGPAHWDREQGLIVNDGDPTVTIKTGQ